MDRSSDIIQHYERSSWSFSNCGDDLICRKLITTNNISAQACHKKVDIPYATKYTFLCYWKKTGTLMPIRKSVLITLFLFYGGTSIHVKEQ